MLTALLLVLALSSERCPSCSVTGKDVELCGPHAEAEHQVLVSAGKRLISRDPQERMGALEELAALTQAHTNAPSPRVVEKLCSALDDESYAVRARAADLLGPPQNALAALDGLLVAFRATESERAALEQKLVSLRESWESRERPNESLLFQQKAVETQKRKQIAALLGWRTILLGRLARFSDDRAVDAILALAPRDLGLGANEALLQLGRRDGVQAAVASLRVFEEKTAALTAAVSAAEKKLDQCKAGNCPKTELMNAEYRLVNARADLQTEQTAGSTVLPELARIAGERGLGPAPSEGTHAAWEQWLAAHVAQLPEHLPGVSSPVSE